MACLQAHLTWIYWFTLPKTAHSLCLQVVLCGDICNYVQMLRKQAQSIIFQSVWKSLGVTSVDNRRCSASVDKQTLAQQQGVSATLPGCKDAPQTAPGDHSSITQIRACSHLEGCVQFSPLHPTGETEMLKTQRHLQTQERAGKALVSWSVEKTSSTLV